MLLVFSHSSRWYLTGSLRRFSKSNTESLARSFPVSFRCALVHRDLRGFHFFLKARWQRDRQKRKIYRRKINRKYSGVFKPLIFLIINFAIISDELNAVTWPNRRWTIVAGFETHFNLMKKWVESSEKIKFSYEFVFENDEIPCWYSYSIYRIEKWTRWEDKLKRRSSKIILIDSVDTNRILWKDRCRCQATKTKHSYLHISWRFQWEENFADVRWMSLWFILFSLEH